MELVVSYLSPSVPTNRPKPLPEIAYPLSSTTQEKLKAYLTADLASFKVTIFYLN